MKNTNIITALLIVLFSLSFSNAFSQTQQQEVFIIGTMHQAPKILTKSYKPLYKKARKYNPEAIYVEYARPEDTLSVSIDSPKLIPYADSLRQVFDFNQSKFDSLMVLNLKDKSKEDLDYLVKSFVIKHDYANYQYYKYLATYGMEGKKKASGNENDDLSRKLALALGHQKLFSMDDQKERPEYYKAWKACAIAGQENGDNQLLEKTHKKVYRSAIIPSLFGRYGMWTNSKKITEIYHWMNSFRYASSDCQPCQDGIKYWDNRNRAMATNIGTQIQENGHQKNLVVVGAGHVIGLKHELEIQFPNIEVKIIADKSYKKTSQTTESTMASK